VVPIPKDLRQRFQGFFGTLQQPVVGTDLNLQKTSQSLDFIQWHVNVQHAPLTLLANRSYRTDAQNAKKRRKIVPDLPSSGQRQLDFLTGFGGLVDIGPL
jgi:hypothetical protein